MTKIYCDHCGKEINGFNDYTEYEFVFENHSYPCDLCKECKESIEKEIDERLMKFLRWKNESK
jgi:hypothetical protein